MGNYDFTSVNMGMDAYFTVTLISERSKLSTPLKNLRQAIEDNEVKKVKKILMKHPALVNPVYSKICDKPPMWEAFKKGRENIVKIFIEKGADPNISKVCGKGKYDSPLYTLVDMCDFSPQKMKFAEYLIEHGAEINARNEHSNVLGLAIYKNSLKWAEFLFEKGAQLCAMRFRNHYLNCPVRTALCNNVTNAKYWLLLFMRYGVDLTRDFDNYMGDKNLLHTLCRVSRNYKNHVKELLDVAVLLIRVGIPVTETCIENNDEYPTLHCAVKSGMVQLVELLIKKGASVKAKTKNREESLIHVAAQYAENTNMLRKLLSLGADVNAKTHSGDTALHVACHKRNAISVAFLLENGADIFSLNYEEKLPMHYFLNEESRWISNLNKSIMVHIDKRCSMLIIKYLAKLAFENKPLSEPCSDILKKNPEAQNHFDNYKEIFDFLSINKLQGVYSYYNIFFKSVSIKKLANFFKNKEIQNEFEVFKNKLPEFYGDTLHQIFVEALLVRDQMLETESRLHSIFFSKFPSVVIRNIAQYLHPEDLPTDEFDFE